MNETLAILVIDDNKDDRILYQRSLKDALGSSLLFMEAGSGESGLEAIEKHAPDCVMLDYSLPGRNGIEVLKRIRAGHPYLPVIMLTGQGNEAVAVQSMKEGAQDYIVKSAITPEALQRVIRVAIEHSAMQKRIHEQRTSLEIFTRALAHDLKEPVRTIRSFLDRISDWQELSEKSQQSFRYIRKAADRMSALIDAVHLYTRLDAAEQMEKTSCSMTDALEEVRENLAQLIEERGATIISDALPRVYANRVQIMQLFQNLVANAIRHCESAVIIHVDAVEQEDNWQFTVRDNGPGVARENLERIFDPFRRLSYRKEDEPGLGLGLAINRKIVESYGGKIWCESMPGRGASFLFTLPKAPAAEKNIFSLPTASGSIQVARATSVVARILLVDDNEADIELNRIMLIEDTRLRCDVLTACGGKEAIEILEDATRADNPIDLILLDINMPGMNGFEVIAEVQKQPMLPKPLIVICTTSAYDVDRRMATSLGAAGYLTKPPRFFLFKDIIAQCRRLQLHEEGDSYALLRTA